MAVKETKKEEKPIILIIEDDEVILRALYLFFHGGDFDVASARDGEEGLEMASRLKPDIILLDLILPKKNGFDVLRDLKSHSTLKKVPVFILSNLGSQDDIKRGKELGAVDYFVKSDTDLPELEKKIIKYVKAYK